LHPMAALAPLFPSHAIVAPLPLTIIVVALALLFAGLLGVAWRGMLPWLAIVAVALYAAMIATTWTASGTPLVYFLIAGLPYLFFVAYAFVAGTGGPQAPYVALVLASVVLLLTAWSFMIALFIAAVMFALLLFWWTRGDPLPEALFAIVASAGLAFFNAALAMLLPQAWTAVIWSIEAAILAALAARFASRIT